MAPEQARGHAVDKRADEAQEKWAELLTDIRSVPTLESLREMTRRFMDALGLTDHERTFVEQRLDAIDERDLQRAFDRRADALSAIGLLMRQTHETIAADLGRREYLR